MPLMIILTDILLLLFWLRICAGSHREVLFNPYVASPLNAANRLVDFLKPVFFGLSESAIAAVALLFLLIFRGALLYNTTTPWVIHLSYGFFGREASAGRLGSCLAFSVASFVRFIYSLWSLALLTLLMAGPRRKERASEALRYVSRPFSDLPPQIQAVVLLLVGVLLTALIDLAGKPATIALPPPLDMEEFTLAWSSPLRIVPQLLIVSLAGFAEVLNIAQGAMFMLLIVSIAASFTGSRRLAALSSEWMNVLFGRFANRSLRAGPLDLRPIAYFLLTGIVRTSLLLLLHAALERLT